jgi:hypothetical protein
MATAEVNGRPEREGVFFIWQRGSRGPIPSIFRGESPPLKMDGDRPFVLKVHPLSGPILEQLGGGDRDGPAVPWTALVATFPPPGEPA